MSWSQGLTDDALPADPWNEEVATFVEDGGWRVELVLDLAPRAQVLHYQLSV